MCAPRVHTQITNCGVQHRPQLPFKNYLVDNLSLKINYDYNCIRRECGRLRMYQYCRVTIEKYVYQKQRLLKRTIKMSTVLLKKGFKKAVACGKFNLNNRKY